jgi:hypothetical protein
MSESTHSMSQGSAPVAIILALALAATVGVSAQSWDVKVAAKQAGGTTRSIGDTGAAAAAAAADEADANPLLRLIVDWASNGRPVNCASPPR